MQSMTGFGKSEGIYLQHQFSVEIRSVNHRYLDARLRLPPALSAFESILQDKLKQQFERGSFEISIRQKLSPQAVTVSSGTRFVVDEAAADSFWKAAQFLKEKYQLSDSPTLQMFLQMNRVMTSVEETPTEELLQGILPLFEEALKLTKSMRMAEGEKLKGILKDILKSIGEETKALKKLSPEQPKVIFDKLQQRIKNWKLSSPIDAQRLETEVAFFAEKSDFTEELDRLHAHQEAFAKLIDEPKAIGRKLDFLVQEFLREVNTLAAKAGTLEISRHALSLRAYVEKLREQVQNVE
jgi:uncharacterized protein (TIGR00255 family)